MHLNRHKPYGHVSGLPGVVFAQDGRFFDGSGRPVVEPEAAVSAGGEDHPPITLPHILMGAEEQPPAPHIVVAPEPAKSQLPADDMRLKENRALKLQMENFGEPWQGINHARKFLGIA